MQSYQPSSFISSHWSFILGMGILTSALAVGLSLFWPLEYQASARVLVTPLVSAQGEVFDQFTAIKSAEQMANTLTHVARTTVFQNRVIQAPYDIKADAFETDARKRRKEWSRKIQAESVPGTGMLVLSVFDEDGNRASALASAVADVLVSSGAEYLPGRVQMVLLDPPLVSRFPMRPNLPFRALAGLVFGSLVATIYILSIPHNSLHDEFRLIG